MSWELVEKPRTHSSTACHGLSKTPEYRSYRSMIYRCTNPTASCYPIYGGRGIQVCDQWIGQSGFEHFLADMGPRPEGTSLDRIDVNGHYDPGNCRWADATTQARNRRWPVRRITAFGSTTILCVWSERSGIPARTISARIARGMTPEEAMTKPTRRGHA